MDPQTLNQRLSQITTCWTMVFQAHDREASVVPTAQRLLLQRYSSAVYRYLLGAVRDPEVATELAQEFALRFLRGAFHRADPQRGRFRDYVKTVLIHLVDDHWKAQRAWPRALSPDSPEPAAPASESGDSEKAFLSSWRQDLLDRTWEVLAQANPTYHAVLLFRVGDPDASSAQMAEQLSVQLGKPLTAATVRKTLQRAHEKFADLLLQEVAYSLETAMREHLQDELRQLDLLKYCRQALERWQPKP